MFINGLLLALFCAAVAGCSYECSCPAAGCFTCSMGETFISVPADASTATGVASASADTVRRLER